MEVFAMGSHIYHNPARGVSAVDGTNKAKIERAALTLFAEHGVDGVSTKSIAVAAGVSEGLLYRHFTNKDGLARELMRAIHVRLTEMIMAAAGREEGLADQISFIVRHYCEIADDDWTLFRYHILPGRKIMMASLRRYTRLMVWGMRVIAKIDVQVTGHEHIPAEGPVIIAAKHQSYGDGFVVFSQFFDLSFVTGDAITKFLFIGRILTKMNAVVINNCGGEDQRKKMAETSAVVREQGRRLLIYPEGHLSKIGTQHKYRKGVYHLYKDFGCPVVPLASNLGQRWNQNDWVKHPDRAFRYGKPWPFEPR